MEIYTPCQTPEEVWKSEAFETMLLSFNRERQSEANGAPIQPVTREDVQKDYMLALRLWEYARNHLSARLNDAPAIEQVVNKTLREVRALDQERIVPAAEVALRMPFLKLTDDLAWMRGGCNHDYFRGKVDPAYVEALGSMTEKQLHILEECAQYEVLNLAQLHAALKNGHPSFPDFMNLLETELRAAKAKAAKKAQKTPPEAPHEGDSVTA